MYKATLSQLHQPKFPNKSLLYTTENTITKQSSLVKSFRCNYYKLTYEK